MSFIYEYTKSVRSGSGEIIKVDELWPASEPSRSWSDGVVRLTVACCSLVTCACNCTVFTFSHVCKCTDVSYV